MSAITAGRPASTRPLPTSTRQAGPMRGEEHRPASVRVVTTRAQRRARPRLLVAIITVGGLFGILAAQLLLTIATSEGAYEIQALQTQQTDLARDEQSLQEQMQVLDAPQHLAAEAQALGMVPNTSVAYLRLSDGDVLGSPTAASASEALRTADDGTPLIPDALLREVPLVGALPADGTEGEAEDASAPGSAEAGAPGSSEAVESIPSVPPVEIPIPNTH